MTRTLGAAELRRTVLAALEGLRAQRGPIDDANVYPVPDGDTGTNLVMTMEAVAAAVASTPDRPADLARAITQASLVGARGNSGVILAQFLRGVCEAVDASGAGPAEAAAGLKRAAELMYAAMTHPREGTMLTVGREAAEAAHGAATVETVFEQAAAAARVSLAKTPEQLPELRRHGVVDAGGIGLVIVIEAFAATMSDRVAEPVGIPLSGARAVRPREGGSLEFSYEVQYLLDVPDDGARAAIAERLSAIGDSVAVVGTGGLLNVHVHTNDVGHAIEIGVEHGRPHSIAVVAFEDQIAGQRGLPLAVSPSPVGVLAVASGDGVRAVFEELGARVASDPAEAAAGLDSLSAPDVIVLNCAAGSLAFDDARRTIEVLDAGNAATGFAAMLAFTETMDFVDNLSAMRGAIATARAGSAGSVLDLLEAVRSLGDGEALTVFTGAGVFDDEREHATAILTGAFPKLALDVRHGGQPGEPFLFVLE